MGEQVIARGECEHQDGGPEKVTEDQLLSVSRIADIERLSEDERWLVEGLLSFGSLTIVASTPKAGKTWVGLSIATAVASGTSALGQFHTPVAGPVLLYPAEDDPRAIRERIESLCLAQQLEIESLPLHVITAHTLRLDEEENRKKLEALIAQLRPKLLVLDPLVRLGGAGMENHVGVADFFAYLRSLQRRYDLAVLVTHHLAKNRSNSAQPGAAMRGSGDIHAAYDHGVLLERRHDGSVRLSIEHRSAPSPDPIVFRLRSSANGAMTFDVYENEEVEEILPAPKRQVKRGKVVSISRPDKRPLSERVLTLLTDSSTPLSQASIRRVLRVKNQVLTDTLRELQARGAVENLGRMKGWQVVSAQNAI